MFDFRTLAFRAMADDLDRRASFLVDRTLRMEWSDVAEADRALADDREYLRANSGWWPSARDGRSDVRNPSRRVATDRVPMNNQAVPSIHGRNVRIEQYRTRAGQLRRLANEAGNHADRVQSLKMAAQYELLASQLVAHEVRCRNVRNGATSTSRAAAPQ